MTDGEAEASAPAASSTPGALPAVDDDVTPNPPLDKKMRMGLALMVACPACAGGFFLAIGAAFGATALALKGFLLVAVLTLVAGLWARNAWNRRNEDAACDLPQPEPATMKSNPEGDST